MKILQIALIFGLVSVFSFIASAVYFESVEISNFLTDASIISGLVCVIFLFVRLGMVVKNRF
jgi:hypothetical protein